MVKAKWFVSALAGLGILAGAWWEAVQYRGYEKDVEAIAARYAAENDSVFALSAELRKMTVAERSARWESDLEARANNPWIYYFLSFDSERAWRYGETPERRPGSAEGAEWPMVKFSEEQKTELAARAQHLRERFLAVPAEEWLESRAARDLIKAASEHPAASTWIKSRVDKAGLLEHQDVQQRWFEERLAINALPKNQELMRAYYAEERALVSLPLDERVARGPKKPKLVY